MSEVPQNIEAEMAVLGSMLIEKRAIDKATELLKSADFYHGPHRMIFDAITALASDERPVDILTVSTRIHAQNQLDSVSFESYLFTLMETPSTAANIEYYCNLVLARSMQRKLMDASGMLASLAQNDNISTDDMHASALSMIEAVNADRATGFRPIGEAINEAVSDLEDIEAGNGKRKHEIPFDELQYLLGGLKDGDLIIIAARPSMGKTALAIQLAMDCARHGSNVALFSLEMSTPMIVSRIICTTAGISSRAYHACTIDAYEWGAISEVSNRMRDTPLWIDDSSSLTITQIKSRCRSLERSRGPLGMIVVDYLQLMGTSSKRDTNRASEVGEISRGLKSLAKEFDCPVIGLSQVNRDCERRPNKRPGLSDLRESGSIEADADIVIFLYRDEYYKPDKEDRPAVETAEAIVAKNRMGPTGVAKIGFRSEYAQFVDMTRE